MYKAVVNIAKDPEGTVFAGEYDNFAWLRPDQISGLLVRESIVPIHDFLGDKPDLEFVPKLQKAKIFTLSEFEATNPEQLALYLAEEVFVVEEWRTRAHEAFHPPFVMQPAPTKVKERGVK